MKFLDLIFLLPFIFSCAEKPTSNVKGDPDEINLIGTWNLVNYIDHSNNGTDWISYPDHIIYQKHLTETHFTWVSYDLQEDQLQGMGGGNYNIQDGKYVENIDFFFPPSSSELGQSIPFDVEFKDGKWYHTGYAKEMELDFNTGEMVSGDSNKIEEVWERTTNTLAEEQGLMGTWDLKHYRDRLGDEYYEYPEMTGYIKLITPTHFAWIKYNKDGDQIYQAGSGTYNFDGVSYIENIEMMYPPNPGMMGSSIIFSLDLTNHQWKHFGYGPVVKEDAPRDSFLIDEIWMSHVNTLEEEVAVSF